jgi:putative sterol carrier protein
MMSPNEIFTLEWARAWSHEICASAVYQAAGRGWRWPLVVTMRADPELGLPEDRSIYLDLYQGSCREGRLATAEELAASPYVMTADPRSWRQVLEGRLDLIPALMRGKVKLVRGSLAALLPHVAGARELVRSAARIESSYPPAAGSWSVP